MGYGFTLIIVVLVVLAVLPALQERRRHVIGATQRHGADGDFAQFSQGVTHYRWVGPVRGPVAVMVHGLASPSIALQGVAEGMGTLGYRVLLYDLYGRGLSDAPRGPQNRAFFMRQLSDLLAHHGIQDDVTLVGYSMGGSITTAFAAENPHRIRRVILLAGAGIVTRESSFSRMCRMIPLLGNWMHGMFAHKRILNAIPANAGRLEVRKVLAAQRKELQRRGFLPAILASRRGMLAENQETEHRKLAHDDVPVVAIWGERDQIVPIAALGKLAEWNRAARQDVVATADHALPYTHDAEVVDALRQALRD